MIYSVEPGIFDRFPDFYRGVVVVFGADNSLKNPSALEDEFRRKIRDVESDPGAGLNHPRIKAWQDIYEKIAGEKSQKLIPSVGALVKRIKQGKGGNIPFISPLVAMSNLVSLTHLVPSGGIDGDKVSGDLVLGFAKGDEHFIQLGHSEPAPINPGEVIYHDSATRNVMCRMWNSKAGRETIISESTTFAVIDVDGWLSVIPREEVQSATEYLAGLVSQYCGGDVKTRYLSREYSEFVVGKGT
ncbi:MAG: hypothetical protein HY865_03685 [Chloroflexi bacterium]|nr:hypothetical protein [Chloroflexota bacterium]